MAAISHPNVLSVVDFGKTHEGVLYIISEYAEGETLQRILRREISLPVSRALQIATQAAAGVIAAHENDVLHLDLKPSAILVIQTKHKTRESSVFVKVGEFNYTALINQGEFEYGVVGTPVYTAPEQFTRQQLDARSDIYALGTITYEMICGRPPFTGSFQELVSEKSMTEAPLLRTFVPDIDPQVERVIMTAIAREADLRPATMAEWMEQLDEVSRQIGEQQLDRRPRDTTSGSDDPAQKYDVFISYRREGSAEAARAIRAELRQRQVRAFLDVDELRSGHFDEALLDCIQRTPNFIVILSPDCLERCVDERDWLRREIAEAIKLKKNILPVTMPGFIFPETQKLPVDIRGLEMHQRVRYDHEYFDAMLGRIVQYLRT
jgi:serine/threonine protein kinase